MTDQLGDPIEVPKSPQRIISLVPSQTELLFDLGLGDRVVGITKFCVHPEEWFRTKAKVGGTKTFDFELIDKLNPDLILGNKEENYEAGILALKKSYPVWMSDINDLDTALAMIASVGEMTGTTAAAEKLVGEITNAFQKLKPGPPSRVLYLIWKKPWMAAGRDTFIHAMLKTMGLANCINTSRYPELTEAKIRELNPDVIFLSSEPYPFKQNHIHELRNIVPHANTVLVDGEMFSWYGSHLRRAPVTFQNFLAQIA